MNKPIKYNFSIIKHRGDLQSATTADGCEVHRQDKIWFEGHGWVKCASYDNHFVFDDPMASKKKGRWTPMCSCGAPAVIVGYNAYIHDASPTSRADSTIPGEMIVCFIHMNTGHHVDGSN